MDNIIDTVLNVVGLGSDEPIAVDYDGDPIPEHALVTIQNFKEEHYKRLIDALEANGNVVTFNNTFDIITVASDGQSFQINLDRPEEELLQEYGG